MQVQSGMRQSLRHISQGESRLLLQLQSQGPSDMGSCLTSTDSIPITAILISGKNTFGRRGTTWGGDIHLRPSEAITGCLTRVVSICGGNGKHLRVGGRKFNGSGLWGIAR